MSFRWITKYFHTWNADQAVRFTSTPTRVVWRILGTKRKSIFIGGVKLFSVFWLMTMDSACECVWHQQIMTWPLRLPSTLIQISFVLTGIPDGWGTASLHCLWQALGAVFVESNCAPACGQTSSFSRPMMTNLAIPPKKNGTNEWANVLVDINWIKLWNEMARDSRRQGKQGSERMRSADKQRIRFGDDPKVSFALESHSKGSSTEVVMGNIFERNLLERRLWHALQPSPTSHNGQRTFKPWVEQLKGQRCFKIIRRLYHANPPSANHIRRNYIPFHATMSRIGWRRLLPYHVQRSQSPEFPLN